MTRRPRCTIKSNSTASQDKPTASGPEREPPAYLGTWRWRQPGPTESTEDWLARTKQQRAAVIAEAANWLRLGQRVKVDLDPRLGSHNVTGRVGTIFRLTGPVFADYTYVNFPSRGREKVPRVQMLPLEILRPVK